MGVVIHFPNTIAKPKKYSFIYKGAKVVVAFNPKANVWEYTVERTVKYTYHGTCQTEGAATAAAKRYITTINGKADAG